MSSKHVAPHSGQIFISCNPFIFQCDRPIHGGRAPHGSHSARRQDERLPLLVPGLFRLCPAFKHKRGTPASAAPPRRHRAARFKHDTARTHERDVDRPRDEASVDIRARRQHEHSSPATKNAQSSQAGKRRAGKLQSIRCDGRVSTALIRHSYRYCTTMLAYTPV